MIRELVPADCVALLTINEACMPAVGPMDAAKLAMFQRIAPFIRVLELNGCVAGFLIGMSESSVEYASPNYRWFAARHSHFAYVDRIALALPARKQGWGEALYEQFATWATGAGKPVLCAEVNTVPDNPPSHRFHQKCGFVEVARCHPYNPQDEVAMYERWITR